MSRNVRGEGKEEEKISTESSSIRDQAKSLANSFSKSGASKSLGASLAKRTDGDTIRKLCKWTDNMLFIQTSSDILICHRSLLSFKYKSWFGKFKSSGLAVQLARFVS